MGRKGSNQTQSNKFFLAVHEEEVSQLMKDLADKDSELEVKLKEVQDKHTAEIAVYQEKVEQLQQGKFQYNIQNLRGL